jgi:hypothetical protein
MVETQPAKIPIWNTGGSNRTEPLTGEKTSGWAVDDEPPSSYFNWLQYYTGAWLTWLNERVYKGSLEHDLTVAALQPDSSGNGGDLALTAGDADTSGDGGGVTIDAGDAAGSNTGGAVGVTAGDGDSGGGAVNLTGGDALSAGPGGSINLTAGAGVGGSEGGDVNIKAGPSTNLHGGDVVIAGGDAIGTDRIAGLVDIESGEATGQNYGQITLKVAEAESGGSGSGSYVNPPVEYLRAGGASGAKHVRASRYLSVENTTPTDPARGVVRMLPKAEPTAPPEGDIYPDQTTHQLAFYNGTRYHNLNRVVYNNSDFAVWGVNPALPSVGTTYVLQQVPYGSSTPGSSALRYIIPAGALRVGSIIRVRAHFALEDVSGAPNYPLPKIYVGSIGSGPPFSSPTGVQIFNPNRPTSLIWTYCYVECELSVRSLGAAGNVDERWRASYVESSHNQLQNDTFAIFNTNTIDTTGALDVFPAAQYTTNGGWDVPCHQFLVEIL